MEQAFSRPNIRISDTGLTALLGILIAFAPFSTDMYLAAFPAMAADLGTNEGGIQLTLSVFFLGMGLGQLFYGPLIDRFGRRKPLLAGIALYTVSSLCMLFAGNLPLFMFLRFMQAVGGCSGMIIGRAIVQDRFNLKEAARTLSLMMAVQSIGPVAAPVVGGYLLGFAPWRVIFVALCGLGISCFLVTFFRLPETLAPEKRAECHPRTIASTFLRILRDPKFLLPALSGSLGSAALVAFISGSPFVLMTIYGLNEVQYGWSFAAIAIGMGVASQINRLLLARFTPESLLRSGLICAILFSCAMSLILLTYGPPALFLFLPLLFCSLVCNPAVTANSTAIAMVSNLKNAGSASSLLGAL